VLKSDCSDLPTETLHNEPLLIRELQSGSQEAFTLLYRYYSPRLYVNIKRMVHDPIVAEEMVQELFTRVWKKRDCKGIKENFTGYMYRIAQHLVHDFFRKLKKDQLLLEKFRVWVEEKTETKSAEDILQQHQSFDILNRAIEHLPVQQKKAYKLVRQEGYTYKKAAESMGISPFTVKEYLALANKSIRNYIHSRVDAPQELMFIVFFYLGIAASH
jgi:RNA polymerase sigma factor (sigma-70 family)